MVVWDWEGPLWEGRGRDLRGVIFVVLVVVIPVEVFVGVELCLGDPSVVARLVTRGEGEVLL
jgi:hypothetical protein